MLYVCDISLLLILHPVFSSDLYKNHVVDTDFGEVTYMTCEINATREHNISFVLG